MANENLFLSLFLKTYHLRSIDNCGALFFQVNETHTNVTSTSLISPVAFKTHYCDLMTPYRALEWIYIGGVKHGPIEY